MTKPKAKRTPKANMNPANSLSAEHLDDWVRPTFDKVLMPTVLDHYGAQNDPWTLEVNTSTQSSKGKKSMTPKDGGAKDNAKDGGDDPCDLVDVLQEIVDSLYPHHFQKLEGNDLLVRVTRQRVINWRRSFLKRAVALVAAAYKAYKAKYRDATSAHIKQWVKNALDPNTGLAFWETPPTWKDPKAHGNLLSTYVLTTFAPHLNSTANSHFEDRPPPIGALSLALAAIDVAFSMHATGEYVAPRENWDNVNGGEVTEWYLIDTVLPTLKKPERWSRFLTRAEQFNAAQSKKAADGSEGFRGAGVVKFWTVVLLCTAGLRVKHGCSLVIAHVILYASIEPSLLTIRFCLRSHLFDGYHISRIAHLIKSYS